jgi:hypothetical protein
MRDITVGDEILYALGNLRGDTQYIARAGRRDDWDTLWEINPLSAGINVELTHLDSAINSSLRRELPLCKG